MIKSRASVLRCTVMNQSHRTGTLIKEQASGAKTDLGSGSIRAALEVGGGSDL
jgi:hypothetical protein